MLFILNCQNKCPVFVLSINRWDKSYLFIFLANFNYINSPIICLHSNIFGIVLSLTASTFYWKTFYSRDKILIIWVQTILRKYAFTKIGSTNFSTNVFNNLNNMLFWLSNSFSNSEIEKFCIFVWAGWKEKKEKVRGRQHLLFRLLTSLVLIVFF